MTIDEVCRAIGAARGNPGPLNRTHLYRLIGEGEVPAARRRRGKKAEWDDHEILRVAAGEVLELPALAGYARRSPEGLMDHLRMGLEALQVARRSEETVERKSDILLALEALRAQISGSDARHDLPAPAVLPNSWYRVNIAAPNAVRKLGELAYAACTRPLMSVEGRSTLSDLGPKSQPLMLKLVQQLEETCRGTTANA